MFMRFYHYTTDFWTDMENDRAVQEAQWVDIDVRSPKDISVLAFNIGYKKVGCYHSGNLTKTF